VYICIMNERYLKNIRKHLNDENISSKYDVLRNTAYHTDREIKIIFPEIKMFSDLEFGSHHVLPDGIQARLVFDNGRFISVVGGGTGLYGNGTTSFEVAWVSDDSGDFEVDGHLDIDSVTQKMVEIQSTLKDENG